MGMGDGHQTIAGEGRSVHQAFQYLRRAALLRCPVCGIKPIFKPFWQVRGLYDWFTPLDGCPICGYPYEREPGYFLLAIFGFNFTFGLLMGVGGYIAWVLSGRMEEAEVWKILATTVAPVPVINVLIARHAKALFIALDHFVDPFVHESDDDGADDDDDGGNKRLAPTPPMDSGGGAPAFDEADAGKDAGVLVGADRR